MHRRRALSMMLRGLSGVQATTPGKYRSCLDGYAVESSLKAEDGFLYPLDKSLFLPKPPTLILHEEIVEFERRAGNFDLLVRLKTRQEHLFRNIQRNEYHCLFDFISGKGIKIKNLGAFIQEEYVVTFEGIQVLTPRGRYRIEFHLSFLRLKGQANEFKIPYSSVARLFKLPKYNQPHTFVVVAIDPPIIEGQTLYPYIVLQFETDHVTRTISDEIPSTQCKDKSKPSDKGPVHDVFFTLTLGALFDAKLTTPGNYRSCLDACAVKSSLNAENGFLYPLEKSFFFLPKPPTLILHEEIDYVGFQRHAGGPSNYDLLIRLKTQQKHLFCNIERNEYGNLINFIRGKGLKIKNLGADQMAEGVAAGSVGR